MQIKIDDVTVEHVPKGRSGYNVAIVSYEDKGQSKTQKIMDFANPVVFKQVQSLVGQEVEVKLVKEGNFWNWKSVEPTSSTGASTAGAVGAPATRVSGSNYETKEERATRQVLIVKQSSLSAAVAALTPGAKEPLDREEVKELAQFFTDFVFDNTLNGD